MGADRGPAEASPVADLHRQSQAGQRRDRAQAAQPVDLISPPRRGRDRDDLFIETISGRSGGQRRIEVVIDGCGGVEIVESFPTQTPFAHPVQASPPEYTRP